MIRQYEEAQEDIPDELQPENQGEEAQEDLESEAEGNSDDRSWFSYMTFGLFD